MATQHEYDEDEVNDYIDALYPPVRIGGIEYRASRVLEELDSDRWHDIKCDMPEKWICDECEAMHDYEDDADECCAEDDDDESDHWECAECGDDYDSESEARDCEARHKLARGEVPQTPDPLSSYVVGELVSCCPYGGEWELGRVVASHIAELVVVVQLLSDVAKGGVERAPRLRCSDRMIKKLKIEEEAVG